VIGAANIRRPITNSMVLTVLSRIGGCPATIRRQSSQLQMRPATKSAAWLTMPLSIKAVALTFVVDAVPVIGSAVPAGVTTASYLQADSLVSHPSKRGILRYSFRCEFRYILAVQG